VPRRLAGMDAEFGGRQLKDQPAVGRVVALDGIPAKHVAQCLAQPLSLARVEEHVRADDRHAVMLRLAYGISPRVRTVAVTGRSSSFGAGIPRGTLLNTGPPLYTAIAGG
jgi:hypothetical protein